MKRLNTFFDEQTFTLTYVLWDEESRDALVIDPVWDIDMASGRLSEIHHQKVKKFLNDEYLNPVLTLETHAHADHLTGALLMKRDFPQTKVGIGAKIVEVQKTFAPIFNMQDLVPNGTQFDLLFEDQQVIKVGSFEIKVIATPGHTPACVSYYVDEHLFSGDALFMPDSGTGRCDFPSGSAEVLYQSIMKLYTLPDDTLVHPGHDYQPGGRELKFTATIAEHKNNNIQIKQSTAQKDYIEFRQARDKTLAAPKLLYPSLQVNIRGGELPAAESNHKHYLKIPLKP